MQSHRVLLYPKRICYFKELKLLTETVLAIVGGHLNLIFSWCEAWSQEYLD